MIAPYDVMWNGKLYPAGKAIPASEKKLIASLTIAAESAVSDETSDEPIAESADETPAAIKTKK